MPHINTSVAYYKRQIWFYNLGINCFNLNTSYMCVWGENEGKRGSNEISSCIFQFLNGLDLSKFNKIHTFSDGCGGQNCNKTVITFFMYVCNSTPIQEWKHTYMESGHSFLPNDTDFGRIERLKNKQNVYTFSAWVDLIEQCKFKVVIMRNRFLTFN